MTLSLSRENLVLFVRNNYNDRGEVASERRVLRVIENGLRDLSSRREWEHLVDGRRGFVSTAPYSTGTVDTISGTGVTLTGSTLPSDIVGAFIQFSGEERLYEITVRVSDTALTLAEAYVGAATSGTTYQIVYPLVELPSDTRKILKVFDVARQNYLSRAEAPALWWLHSRQTAAQQPRAYAIVRKRHDPNVRQILFYPPPGTTVEQYWVTYVRHAGWYSSATPATSIWKMRSTADTDYVDWPEDKQEILEAAIMTALFRETKAPELQTYQRMYDELLDMAESDDNDFGEHAELGDSTTEHDIPWIRIEP